MVVSWPLDSGANIRLTDMSPLRAPTLIVIAVALGLIATLLWRAALVEVGGVELGSGTVSQLVTLAGTWKFWLGVVALLAVMVITLDLYSSEDLSRVVPLFSLSYLGVALIGRYHLGETVTAGRWIGIAFIVVGVAVVVWN